MGSTELLEWQRSARNIHDTIIVALPREWGRRWKLTRGSTLTISLQEDGSLKILPSEKELEIQEKLRNLEAKQ